MVLISNYTFVETESVPFVVSDLSSPFLPLSLVTRDVWNRDPVLLLLSALPGHAQLFHLSAHVRFCHVAHHHCTPCFRKYHLQPE